MPVTTRILSNKNLNRLTHVYNANTKVNHHGMVHFFVFFLFAFEITTLDWSIDFIANVQDIVSIEKIDEMCGGGIDRFPHHMNYLKTKGF